MARKKFATNIRQMTAQEFSEQGVDIVQGMIDCINAEEETAIRFNMLKDVASFIYAKPKQVELTGQLDNVLKVVIGGAD